MDEIRVAILALALTVLPFAAYGDCLKNLEGDVICGKGQCEKNRQGDIFCSRYEDGAAVRTRDGQILCGKGQCIKTSDGRVFCSTVERGSALTDLQGNAKCEGRCELASPLMCESTPAGSS